ncbi:MAG: HEAT repeat domain-containing protein [Planctomycetota bacterium]|nr:HEAT repeat domain-containing protein [Planctomycetota bacterium]
MWSTNSSALVLVLVASACAGSPSKGTGADPEEQLAVSDFRPDLVRTGAGSDAEVLSVDELPEEHREVLEAWRTGGFTWAIKRGDVLSDPALTSFLVDNLLLLVFEEHQAIRGIAKAARASDAEVEVQGDQLAARRAAYARARAELPRLGKVAAEAVAAATGLGDDTLFALVKDILADMGPDGAPAVAGLLQSPSALVRYRAASMLGRLPSAGLEEPEVYTALQAAAENDASEIVRVQATRALGERGLWASAGRNLTEVDLAPSRLALEACLDDDAEAVRLEAIGGLSLLGDRRAVEALLTFGRDARRDQRLRDLSAAGKTIRSLTGKDLGVDVDAWAAWWETNEEAVEAAGGQR